ncbi:MAG TPA: GNAT family N-acetyltransferase [Bryobacteraceae bacterium]|nr:GNAT family N-acetyltransferase [Bryobacteraceae bacterium]
MTPASPTIRDLKTEDEFRELVHVQELIWGFSPIDLLPVRFFVVASKIGGQVFGAYDAGRLVAFCLAIPGLKPGNKPYLHSHMLGVLPEYRDSGLGRRLKMHQRELALARGLTLIEWTFDPLETKNAYFNIERLGAIIRTYNRNQYGATSSQLGGGLPTDRCVAEWWIAQPRERGVVHEGVRLPIDIAGIRRVDPGRARAIQLQLADDFEAAFAKGLAVIGVERDETWFTYLLGDPPAGATL